MRVASRPERSIYLVRAAQTSLSAEDRFVGRLDPSLDAEGLEQARAVAKSLARTGAGAVFTSPLRRSQETATVIAQAVGSALAVLDDLTDVDMGAWTGLTMAEASSSSPVEFDRFFQLPQAAEVPGGGWMWETQRRMLLTLGEIGANAPGDVVVVTHELPIRLVLVKLRHLERTALWDPAIPPGSVTRLRFVDGDLQIPTVLEDLLRTSAPGTS